MVLDACIKNKIVTVKPPTSSKQAQSRLNGENSSFFNAAEIFRFARESYLRRMQDLDQAEHYLCKGLEVAREQKAKSFELRVCLSMCDLYELRADADKCRSQLSTRFTELLARSLIPSISRQSQGNIEKYGSLMFSRIPLWVNRVSLAARRSLPVLHEQRTSSDCPGIIKGASNGRLMHRDYNT